MLSVTWAEFLTIQNQHSDIDLDANESDYNVKYNIIEVGGGIYNGGILLGGTLMVINSQVSENSARNGGGIYETGMTTITNSDIVGNAASANGGGIYSSGNDYYQLTVANSLIAGNSAENGGGIYSTGTSTIKNCTIAGNLGTTSGGGIYYERGTLTLSNTIVAKNISHHDIYDSRTTTSPVITGNNNLIGNGDGLEHRIANGINGNIVGNMIAGPIDPQFVHFVPYLQEKWTSELWQGWNLRLAAGFPAIDAGRNTLAIDDNGNALLTDKDGYWRIVINTVDIGAYESFFISLIAPNFSSVTATNSTTVNVTWNAIAHATGYTIQYSTDASFNSNTVTIADIGATATARIISELTPNTLYYIRIMANGTGNYGNSIWSEPGTITTSVQPPMPTNFRNTDKTYHSATLAWNAVANATGYEIQYREYGIATWTNWTDNPTIELSAIIEGLAAEMNYEFQIRAIYDNDTSDWSDTITVVTDASPLATPNNLHSISITKMSIALQWNAVGEATGYDIRYRTGDSDWSEIISVTELSANITNLLAGTLYEFEVRATTSNQESAWSTPIGVTTDPLVPPETPTGLTSISRTADSIAISWNAVNNAMSYEIRYRTGNANWTSISTVETAVVIIDNLIANTTYEFQVRAVNNEGMSEWSSIISIMTDTAELGTPTLMSAVATGHDTITVTWEAASNADAYRVEYSRSPIFTGISESVMIEPIGGILATTTNLTGLLASTTYYIRVIALTGNNLSEWSNILHTSTDAKQLTTPVISSISVTGTTSLKVEWSTVQHADGYMMTYFTGEANAPQTISVSSNTTSAIIAGLQTGQEYAISITAIGTGEYINSANSDAMQGIPTAQQNVPVAVNPTGVKMMNAKSAHPPTLNSVSLEWRANAANVAYFITQNDTAIPAERITYITNAQGQLVGATITGLESGTRYNFTVAAYNANNEKAQRDITVRATTLAENRAIVKSRAVSSVRGIDGTGLTINTVQISWNILTSEISAYQITIKGSAPNPANSSRMLVQDLATMTISNDGIITNIVMRDIIVNGINVNPLLEERLLQSRYRCCWR